MFERKRERKAQLPKLRTDRCEPANDVKRVLALQKRILPCGLTPFLTCCNQQGDTRRRRGGAHRIGCEDFVSVSFPGAARLLPSGFEILCTRDAKPVGTPVCRSVASDHGTLHVEKVCPLEGSLARAVSLALQ